MNPQELILRRGDEERRAVFVMVDENQLDSFVATPQSLLGPPELVQLAGLHFPQKKRGFLLGRLAAKSALGAMLAEPEWSSIEIRAGVFGQPVVRHPRALGVDVTVSHSQGIAVALAYPAEWPIGIDLETVSDDAAATVLPELDPSADEQAWLAARVISASAACGVLWTAREALAKAMKTGLNCPLGILSLCAITATGAAAWTGGYTNFPQSKWLAHAKGERILSVAMPSEIELGLWPPALAD